LDFKRVLVPLQKSIFCKSIRCLLEVKSACIVFELHENNLQTSINMRVRDKKRLVKVGNLVKNPYLYR